MFLKGDDTAIHTMFRPSKANDLLLKLMTFSLFTGVTQHITYLLQAYTVMNCLMAIWNRGEEACFLRVPVL